MSPTAAAETPTLIQIAIGDLFPSPLNPRKKFTAESLRELADNIQKRGEVVQPLLLRSKGKKFEIIDGERRYHASKVAGNITSVYGMVRDDLTDGDVIEFMLLTSIQKQELTPLEEAGGFKALIDSNKAKYSAAYIADRIGRSEKFVWDRMKLLDLIPILKKLLEAERILVGHAELLAKLKPEDQERISKWRDRGYGRGDSGLWEQEDARLDFEGGKRPKPTVENLYAGLKPVTVKELETYIAEHIRFDVEHMAKSAPLEFAETAQQVEAAAAQPGRGKKVISITHDHRVDDAAKDPSERTYGSQSWRRADGRDNSKECEFSVLGVFVAGPSYGKTLQVCVNRDKCTVHFGKVIKERERNAKLRQQGKGGKAAQNEQAAAKKAETSWERDARIKKALEKAWEPVWPHIQAEAIAQAKQFKKLTPGQIKALEQTDLMIDRHACKDAGVVWHASPIVALLVSEVSSYYDYKGPTFDGYVKKVAKPFGLDIKKLEAIRDKHTPKTEQPAPAKAAKKAKKR